MSNHRRTFCVVMSVVLPAVLLALTQPGVASAAPLNDCVADDNGDPRLTAFELSPTAVDVTTGGRQVRFTVRVEDAGGPGPASGVKTVSVLFGRRLPPALRLPSVVLRRDDTGAWVGSATIPRWSKEGTLLVHGVKLADRAGNRRLVTGKRLAALGFPHAVSVTSTPDITAPVLRAFGFTPPAVDTRTARRTVTFTARVTDTQSHVLEVVVVGDMNGDSIGGGRYGDLVFLTRVAGTANTYRGTMRVHRWVGSGTWRAYVVYVSDRIGNYQLYGGSRLDALGFRRTLRVTSRSDTGSPNVAAWTIKPASVDIRTQDQVLTFRVHATDAVSGVGRVVVGLGPYPGDSTFLRVRLHRVSGTARDGVWVGSTTLARCTATDGHLRTTFMAVDRASNRGESSSRFTVQALDHVAPRADLYGPDEFGTVTPSGRIRVPFSENVNGINTTSATVREEHPDGSLGPAVPGTWTCVTGNAAPTNCETGKVRIARFTPTTGFVLDHTYQLQLNPQFSLGVTDLAGNPFRRERGWFTMTT